MSRKRNIKKSFWINDSEEEKLKALCNTTGKNESELFRDVIQGKNIKEKPQEEFYQSIRELRQLSNALSRMVLLAKDIDDIDVDYINENIKLIDLFIVDIKRKYLL